MWSSIAKATSLLDGADRAPALTSVEVEGAIRSDQSLRFHKRQRDLAEQHEALVPAEDAQHRSALGANHRCYPYTPTWSSQMVPCDPGSAAPVSIRKTTARTRLRSR